MTTIIAHSSSRSAGAWRDWQYEVLHQIWRDACSDDMAWIDVPKAGSGEDFYRSRVNRETGDTITCQGHGDRSHTFTFVGA